jgi:hypothetical protein
MLMATYREVSDFVRRNFGFVPKSCWIAHVKELSGLPVKRAWNRSSQGRKMPCPLEKVEPIRAAFRHFGML